MRFTQTALLAASVIGMAQGLIVPERRIAVAAPRAAADLLTDLVSKRAAAQVATCKAGTKECPTCPKVPKPKPATAPPKEQKPGAPKQTTTPNQKPNQNPPNQNPPAQKPGTQNPPAQNPPAQKPGTQNPPAQKPATQNPPAQKPPKCTGTKCKRDEETEDIENEAEFSTLDERGNSYIGMDAVDVGTWKPMEMLQTVGLGGCSVFAVYDETNYAWGHIPPARSTPETGWVPGAEVVSYFLQWFDQNLPTIKKPRGYLLVHEEMDKDNRAMMEKWFKDNKITVDVKVYNNKKNNQRGNFWLMRGVDNKAVWPPKDYLE